MTVYIDKKYMISLFSMYKYNMKGKLKKISVDDYKFIIVFYINFINHLIYTIILKTSNWFKLSNHINFKL